MNGSSPQNVRSCLFSKVSQTSIRRKLFFLKNFKVNFSVDTRDRNISERRWYVVKTSHRKSNVCTNIFEGVTLWRWRRTHRERVSRTSDQLQFLLIGNRETKANKAKRFQGHEVKESSPKTNVSEIKDKERICGTREEQKTAG